MSVDNEESDRLKRFEQRHRELLDNVEDAQAHVRHVKFVLNGWLTVLIGSAVIMALSSIFIPSAGAIPVIFGALFIVATVMGVFGAVAWALEGGFDSPWKELRDAQRRLRDHQLKEL